MTAARAPRSAFSVLAIAAGFALWAVHFTLIYAINAFACERGYEAARLLGLPWVPVMVVVATLLVLLPLALLLRGAFGSLRRSEGGEAEPDFSRWFTAAAAGYAILAVLFQAAPSLVLPACGVGY
jgi:heme/copper-type cytochrome/quinol oxidase subunit 1